MGYSLCWLAIRGKAPAAVLAALGFQETEEREEIPESEFTAAELPNNWYLIVANGSERVASDDRLQQLSSDCELVTCFVEEHVMVSFASGWSHGHKTWSVVHDGQYQSREVEVTGELPASFGSILSGLQAKQREADACKRGVDFIFDAPVELARSIAGYRHDQDVSAGCASPFTVLTGGFPIPGVNYTRFQELEHKWMRLAGWQRGVLGTVLVLAALFVISCVVTWLVIHFT